MRKFNLNIFLVAIVFIVVLSHIIAYRNWLFSSSILTHGDWFASTASGSKELLTLPQMWKAHFNGIVDVTPTFYLFQLFEGILSHLGFGYGFIQRITFLWPIALLTPLFSFILFKKITNDSLSAISAALLYSYNTYFIIIQTGHLTLMTSFTFAPIAILAFMNYLHHRSIINGILTGLVLTIISFYEIRGMYLLSMILFIYWLIHYRDYWEFNIKGVISSLITCAFPMIVVILFHSYWILPFLNTEQTFSLGVFNRVLFGKGFFSIQKSLALFHPFWTGKEYHPFIVQPIGYFFYTLPLLLIYGLTILKKKRIVLFFAFVAVVGIFLTKQNNPPFTPIYELLYAYLPGFNAFREASKFYFITAIGYSGIIALLIASFKKRNLFIYLALSLTIVGSSILNLRPLITSEIGTMFTPRVSPSSYDSLNAFIDTQDEFFKTLWVPVDSRWSTMSTHHPRISATYIIPTLWRNLQSSSTDPHIGPTIVSLIQSKQLQDALNFTGIKYVIVPLQDTANEDDFFKDYFVERLTYVQSLDNAQYLRKLDLKIPGIDVYENPTHYPHIFKTTEDITSKKDLVIEKVPFKSITSTEHIIKIAPSGQQSMIHFTDVYHPSWKLHFGEFNWLSSILEKNYWYPSKYHLQTEYGNNSWIIDPEWLKSNGYSMDQTIRATLYFAPQAWMNIGLIISSLWLVILIAIVCYVLLRRIYEKKIK